MDVQLPEGVWIDRFVVELAREGAAFEPELLIDLARELWPFLGDLPPERVASCNWNDEMSGA